MTNSRKKRLLVIIDNFYNCVACRGAGWRVTIDASCRKSTLISTKDARIIASWEYPFLEIMGHWDSEDREDVCDNLVTEGYRHVLLQQQKRILEEIPVEWHKNNWCITPKSSQYYNVNNAYPLRIDLHDLKISVPDLFFRILTAPDYLSRGKYRQPDHYNRVMACYRTFEHYKQYIDLPEKWKVEVAKRALELPLEKHTRSPQIEESL